jgi:hypothetical protein
VFTWAIVMGVVGIALLVFAITHYGFDAMRRSIGSAGGLTMLLALVLLTGALGAALVGLSHRDDRKKLDAALVEMFGRAPDKLDLSGDSMTDFNGIAQYDGKLYRIQVNMAGMRDTAGGGVETKYRVTATPLGPATAP